MAPRISFVTSSTMRGIGSVWPAPSACWRNASISSATVWSLRSAAEMAVQLGMGGFSKKPSSPQEGSKKSRAASLAVEQVGTGRGGRDLHRLRPVHLEDLAAGV